MRKILVGIPHSQFSRTEFERSLLNTLEKSYIIIDDKDISYECTVMDLIGNITDDARNIVCARAINEDFTDVFFLDDDMLHPRFALHDLLIHRNDNEIVIGGMYTNKIGTRIHVYDFRDGIFYPMILKPNTGLHKCDAVASGCMLIPTSILKKIPFPWFYYKYTEISETYKKSATITLGNKYYAHWSEDTVFCHNVKKAGFDIYVDSNVNCFHLTTMAIGLNDEGQMTFNMLKEMI